MYIENIFNSRYNIKILRALFSLTPGRKWTLKELNEIRIPRATLLRQLNTLINQNIIKKDKIGKEVLYYINTQNTFFNELKNLFAKETEIYPFRLNINNLLADLIYELKNLDIEKIIVFGSHARGTSEIKSDIDLLIITEIPELKIKKKMDKLERKYRININSLIHTSSEVEKLKNEPLFKIILREGILIKNG